MAVEGQQAVRTQAVSYQAPHILEDMAALARSRSGIVLGLGTRASEGQTPIRLTASQGQCRAHLKGRLIDYTNLCEDLRGICGEC